jgi:hypothetical protein
MKWYFILFFRFVNFFSVMGLLYYFYKRSVAPFVRAEIDTQTAQQMKIHTKQHFLEKSLSLLQAQVEKERILFDQLQTKIIAWKIVVEEKKRQTAENQILIKTKLQERLLMQEKNEADRTMQNRETIALIKITRDGMHKKYENVTNREQFCGMIIEKLASDIKSSL